MPSPTTAPGNAGPRGRSALGAASMAVAAARPGRYHGAWLAALALLLAAIAGPAAATDFDAWAAACVRAFSSFFPSLPSFFCSFFYSSFFFSSFFISSFF